MCSATVGRSGLHTPAQPTVIYIIRMTAMLLAIAHCHSCFPARLVASVSQKHAVVAALCEHRPGLHSRCCKFLSHSVESRMLSCGSWRIWIRSGFSNMYNFRVVRVIALTLTVLEVEILPDFGAWQCVHMLCMLWAKHCNVALSCCIDAAYRMYFFGIARPSKGCLCCISLPAGSCRQRLAATAQTAWP